MKFKQIEFGNADAREEGAFYPHLLTQGFLDINEIISQVQKPSTFLFLGTKGSGKSALSEHMRLSFGKYDKFIKSILLKDFPYKSFKKIIEGTEEVETKLPKAWNWLLLIYVLDSLSKDKGLKRDSDNNYDKTLIKLKQAGILPSENINDIVNKSSKRAFKFNLTGLFTYAHETKKSDDNEIQFYHIVQFLKSLISKLKTDSEHYLVIDGLDEVLSTRDKTNEIQYLSLAALLNESKSLNHFFRINNLPIKIILLCRTDLFEKLPDPNKNKIRRDSSFFLNWHSDSISVDDSPIIKLANLRGSLSVKKNIDIFSEYFPQSLEGKDIRQYLLQYTRHTPRDFLQLLKFIQESCVNGTIEIITILNAIKSYSSRYFLPEIRDELVGYTSQDQIDIVISALSTIHSKEFNLTDFETRIKDIKGNVDINVKEVLILLYECGAIGQTFGDNSSKRYSFKYRNPHISINFNCMFAFHRGLWKAFNIS